MQTFLPYPDFTESLRTLDPKRLGNQVYREGVTLIKGGWRHHPASKMWRGHEHTLSIYVLTGIEVLKERGKDYSGRPWAILTRELSTTLPDTGMPLWIGMEAFHASHRSSLLRKDYAWYSKFGWKEPPNLPYIWPTP